MTRIVITGMGCLSPLGNSVQTTWEGIKAGRSGIATLTRLDISTVETKIGGEVKGFEPEAHFGHKEARRMDRFSQLAVVAALQAVEDANYAITPDNTFDTAVLVSNGFGGPETLGESIETFRLYGTKKVKPTSFPAVLPNIVSASIAMRLGSRGVCFNYAAACATSAVSIGEGAELIKRGDAEVVLVGGTEASLVPYVLAGLNSMRAMSTRNDDPECASRPFDANRDGFVPAEGAAVLVLESLEHARSRGAHIYGELVGYAASCDAWHVTAPDSEGTSITYAIRRALQKAGLTIYDIDYINAHGTSTLLGDLQETRVIKQVFGEHAYKVPISSTKSMTGHAMSTSGAFEAIFSIMALNDGIMPPTINLETPDPACDLDYIPNVARAKPLTYVMSNSFGFGGQNAILIFKKYTE
ncbi:MAG: beta-ketoacyl-ACP synthase II [Anaerolineae bacterium]|nr:beta-ketoacyl-ACP synthase II [Anaerolineae bacterium]